MSNITICRVCLADNLRMHAIANTQLHEIYEILAYTKLDPANGKPTMLCYICLVQLQRCHDFVRLARRSETLLANLFHSELELTRELLTARTMERPRVERYSITPVEYVNIREGTMQTEYTEEARNNIKMEHFDNIPQENNAESHRHNALQSQRENIKEDPDGDRSDCNAPIYLHSDSEDDLLSESLKNEVKIEGQKSGHSEKSQQENITEDPTGDAADCNATIDFQSDSEDDIPLKSLKTSNTEVELERQKRRYTKNVNNKNQSDRSYHPANPTDNSNMADVQFAPCSDDDFDIQDALNEDYEPSLYPSSLDSENEIASDPLESIIKKEIDLLQEIESEHQDNDNLIEQENQLEQQENDNTIEQDDVVPQENDLEDISKSKRVRQRDFCFYCKSFILNFARHMVRKHSHEPDIQLALSYPKNSITRKKMLADIRKKGNFISHLKTAFKPVKKCRFFDKTYYVSCSKCLGFYSKKNFWKHTKGCDSTVNELKHQENQNIIDPENVCERKNLLKHQENESAIKQGSVCPQDNQLAHQENDNTIAQDNTYPQENELKDLLNSKRVRQRNFCFYCKSFILNFARHMIRKHLAEPDILLALLYPKNSITRKKMLADIRKKGNFISHLQTTFKPVKKCRFFDKTFYLSCSKCLGFYSKKHLWKHLKRCDSTVNEVEQQEIEKMIEQENVCQQENANMIEQENVCPIYNQLEHHENDSMMEQDNICPQENENMIELENVCLQDNQLEHQENDYMIEQENVCQQENQLKHQENHLEDSSKRKHARQRDFCFYCKSFILNFARHMVRKHSDEPDIQLALSYPKNSITRKKMLADIRKKGNFVSHLQTAFKPVKKCKIFDKNYYLPCTECLGFYSKKFLWKHVKECDSTASTRKTQVEAQNFLLRNVKVDKDLMAKVFPRMKPDKVSLIAKKDKLICAFGAQYLRTHREENCATVSRKMRQLAKLLMEVTKSNFNIVSLKQLLKPQHYNALVRATKIVARYDDVTNRFGAPTYAINIATSLKQCCSVALSQSYKTGTNLNIANIQADLKTLSTLIGQNWKSDVCNLNVKKNNTIAMVPLATDLKLFKDHLNNVATMSSEKLNNQDDMNVDDFNNLVESTYCRVLLLNRRRPGELQRLKLSEYNNNGNDSNKHDNVLSTAEEILVNKLKRIMIRDKKGNGVAVLFSTEIQNDINMLLSLRPQFIPNDNDILFLKAGGTTVCGYKDVVKHAKACGAENYTALTSTRLRKHLATMTQLLSMTELELERLATFMGHTLNNKGNYTSPSDVYQTAKITKLLLLMEDGKDDTYRGKTLDEIDVNLDVEIKCDEIENREAIDFEKGKDITQNVNLKISELSTSKNKSQIVESELKEQNSSKKTRILVPWTSEQKNIVTNFFKDNIEHKRAPKRRECDELKSQHPTLLHNKDWLKIKVFIQNVYSKK